MQEISELKVSKPLVEKQQKPVFKTLQVGRGLAAVLVVLVHLSGALSVKFYGHTFSDAFAFGHAGVEYFFVISGFIIAYLHWQDIDRYDNRGSVRSRFSSFLRKRFVRIYPVYWLVCLLVLPIYFLGPRFIAFHGSWMWSLLDDLTLLPTAHLPDLSVAWTLKHEILFYGCFALMILNRRLGILVATIALLGSIYVMVDASVSPARYFSADVLTHENRRLLVQTVPFLFFNPLHLLFLYGAGVAWAVRRWTIPFPTLLAVLGTVIFFGAGAYESWFGGAQYEIVRSQVFGLGAAIGMAGFIEWERSRFLAVPQFWCLLGDASYSLYLIHFALLSGLLRLTITASNRLAAHHVALPEALAFWVLFCIAIGAGILFHIYVEKPLLSRLSKRKVTKLQADRSMLMARG